MRTLSILIAGTTELIDARTSRVLISLVASMTAGAIILMSLESGTSHHRRELVLQVAGQLPITPGRSFLFVGWRPGFGL